MASRARDKYGLTNQQREFADEYLLTKNATQSYLKCYRCSAGAASAAAARLLTNVNVTAYVVMRQEAASAKAVKKYDISQERIFEELAKLAFFDIRSFMDEDGNLINPHDMEGGNAAVIAGFDASGYKLPNKITALDLLMKAQGMLEKHQNAGRSVTVIKVPDITKEPGAGEGVDD